MKGEIELVKFAPEMAPDTEGVFEYNLERVFKAADLAETEFSGDSHFRVEWDAASPTQINNVITAAITPTGARRQEHKGKFSQAQFLSIEHSDHNPTARIRYIWCRTGAQPTGTIPAIDERQLYQTFGYMSLEPNNLIRVVPANAKKALNDIGGFTYCIVLVLRNNPRALIAKGSLVSPIRRS